MKSLPTIIVCLAVVGWGGPRDAFGQEGPAPVTVEGQPLASSVERLLQASRFLGSPHPVDGDQQLNAALQRLDGDALQRLLDPHVLLVVHLNPEMRVKVARGPAKAVLRQGGYSLHYVKVVNESTATPRLRLTGPQLGPVYGGASLFSLQRQQQPELNQNENAEGRSDRFLDAEFFAAPPMTDRLSGLEVEYLIGLFYSDQSGKREALLGVDADQGNQDLGFRAETPVLFDIRPARPVTLRILDHDGQPAVAKLIFRDAQDRVYPPRAKRLAPDFFFQDQIYRADGETIVLPQGPLTVQHSRGPEYHVLQQPLEIDDTAQQTLEINLRRWIEPSQFGFYSGDHHIHGAGCAHYTVPTQGVSPADMFRQVKGEGLNVGCVLTWGPCFDFQRQFFRADADAVSEPLTVLKYDLEISGFGSQALGHVCLLNLRDQEYPGSQGSSSEGWPTWTTPVMRWAKQQGGYAGYAHSASGLHIDPPAAAARLLQRLDQNQDQTVSEIEAQQDLLPEPFAASDLDGDQRLTLEELLAAHQRAAEQLPNYAIPEMNGVGAMEICVAVNEGVCDFISSMDTRRIQEWNTWYHLLNCGYPLKISGETDFPCMSSTRVGQGRVYVRLGAVERVDFGQWCQAMAAGKSYVSDGFAHAVNFEVQGVRPGEGAVELEQPATIVVRATAAFAPRTPETVAHGLFVPVGGRSLIGDTVERSMPRGAERWREGGSRNVELIVNGQAVATREVAADGQLHDLEFQIPIQRSSWVALRQFPQLHTNPVAIVVDGRPIRASRRSALWCAAMTRQLWRHRQQSIAEPERDAARTAFESTIDQFLRIAHESAD